MKMGYCLKLYHELQPNDVHKVDRDAAGDLPGCMFIQSGMRQPECSPASALCPVVSDFQNAK